MCWFFPHGTRSRFNDFRNPLKRISSRISLYILLCVWITYRTPVWWLQVTLPWDAAFWSMMISTSPPPKKKQQVKVNFKRKKGKKNESRNLQQHHFNLNWRLAVPYQHSTTLGESFLILKTPSQKKQTKNVVLFVQPTERNRYTSTYHLRGNANLKREKRTEVKANFEVRLTTSDTRWWWFSLYFIIGLFYRSMAPGERTNDCRWRTCFCIIRKKEKKRYGIV